MKKIIEVKNLTKNYGSLKAVNNVSFEVRKGEIFGLLGENGAGKTTILEIIEGLRKPTKGKIEVLGHNIKNNLNSVKEKIGVQLQASAYYHFLSLKEILDLFGSFYPQNANPMRLLNMVGLKSKANSYISSLSGGQKQRFSIIASLINNPQVVFLDEPTTGLDPLARRNLWEIITQIQKQDKTIILTTHYMEEAEILCDRIAIMDSGKIIASGTFLDLIAKAKYPYKINFMAPQKDQKITKHLTKLGKISEYAGKLGNCEIRLKSQKDVNLALKLIKQLKPRDMLVRKASLEDLFIELTGRTIKE